jgi:hypothetical protein
MYRAVLDNVVLNMEGISEPYIAVLMIIWYEYLQRPVMATARLNTYKMYGSKLSVYLCQTLINIYTANHSLSLC